jgi:hypothetical protein
MAAGKIRPSGARRQRDRKAVSPLRVVDDVASVTMCDLPDQREAKPGTLLAMVSGATIKRGKKPLARFFINDRSTIPYIEHGLAVLGLHRHLDGRFAVALGIVDEIADHSAQQGGIAVDHGGLACD